MAGIKQIEASKLAPLSERLDALDKQEAEEAEVKSATIPALSEAEWLRIQPKLETMSKEQLIATVRRFACQCGVVALMTREEKAQAMRDVLAETALRPIVAGLNMKADIQSRLLAI